MSEEDHLVGEVLDGSEPPHRAWTPIRRPLSPGQHERVQGVLAGLCLLFGITGGVLISSGPGGDNAYALGTEQGAELRFAGAWPAALDDRALEVVLAHELGHIAAHHPRTPFGRAKQLAADRWLPIDRRFSWATEITADRYSLIGSSVTPDQIGQIAGHGGGSHPDIDLRVQAARLFTSSDRYRQLTGRGRGAIPIAEIEGEIAALLPDPERPIYRLDGVDVLETPDWLERRWERRRRADQLIS